MPKKSESTPLQQKIANLKACLPPQQDWRSTDEQEIARRQVRALESPPTIQAVTKYDKVHSTFEVTSADSELSYLVQVIDLSQRLFFSSSPDFATNGLGTCKHTEAVLFHLQARFPRIYKSAAKNGPPHLSLIHI